METGKQGNREIKGILFFKIMGKFEGKFQREGRGNPVNPLLAPTGALIVIVCY